MTSTVSTSYTLIPNQKYRRSNRRSRRFCKILDIDSQSLSTLGDFKALPVEIFQMVLEHLSGENQREITLLPLANNNQMQKSVFLNKSHFD